MECCERYTAGTICRARCTHRGTRNGELTFKNGDVLIVVKEINEATRCYEMITAGGNRGSVVSSLLMDRVPVPMHPMPWFHGSITRFEAEKLLDRNVEGQFLLRTSQHTNGIFALAVICGGAVRHYLLAMNFKKRRLTIDGKVYLDSLCELVEYYKNQTDFASAVKLTEPVTRQSQLEFFVDSNILEQKWGLSRREIVVNQVIGKGEFGEVHAGEYRELQVAIKTLLSQKQNAQAISNFTREAAIMSHLCHPNVVQLVGVHYYGNTLQSIIMELMGKGALSKYLMTRGRSVISQKELLSFAKDVCNGMVYLSDSGFVHRDIAARNVLLNGNGQAKISDLGLARKADIYVPNEGGKFPTKWTAPEALKGSRFSVMSDVWSYGILLWEIFSFGRVPFPSIPSDNILEQLEDGYRMDPPDSCPNYIYTIMEECWMMEPLQRPLFPKLLEMLTAGDKKDSRVPSPTMQTMLPARGLDNLEPLATSPIAISAYKEAPKTRKVTLFLASILMCGPEGSGKTSFVRSLKGEDFRMHEPSSVAITLEQILLELRDHLHWKPTSCVLSFEEQLVHVIVGDILKDPANQFGLHSTPISRSQEDLLAVDGLEFRRRSSSIPVKPSQPKPKVKRRFLSSFKKSQSKKLGKGEKDTATLPKLSHPPSSKGPPKITVLSDDGAVLNGHSFNSDSPSGIMSPFVIPEPIVKRIVETLNQCTPRSMQSSVMYGKIIDSPGGKCHSLLRSLLVTPSSLSVVTFDVSLDPYHVYAESESPSAQKSPSCTTGHSIYLDHILNEVTDICLHQPQDELQRGARIVLVGTHCDKVSMSIASNRLRIVTQAVNDSPFKPYVAAAKFVASSSSILERSNFDEIKRYLMDLTRKLCRQQVPLRWLHIIPKIDQLDSLGRHFITLEQLRTLAHNVCGVEEEDDFDQLLGFLSGCHIILHFDLSHMLRNVIITSPTWFLKNISTLLSLNSAHNTEAYNSVPQEMDVLTSSGRLSENLLNLVWKDVTNKAELLQMMHKMELICCLSCSSDSSDAVSVNMDGAISQIFIPALVEEEAPSYISSDVSNTELQPLYFRFKTGRVPAYLYYRLVARCIQSYPSDVKLYVNNACFGVDGTTTLILSLKSNFISLMLQETAGMKRLSSYSEDGQAIRESCSSMSAPSHDVCLAVLMFVQAAIMDIIHQWIPQMDFDLCVPCHCTHSSRSSTGGSHYIVLNDSEEWMEAGLLVCELGSQFLPLLGITRWFGASSDLQTSVNDDIELVTVDDIIVVANTLGHSWRELGHLLGFSDDELRKFSIRRSIVSLPAITNNSSQEEENINEQSPGERMLREWLSSRGVEARLFSLLSALEIIQRRDVADSLIAARMVGPGVMI